MIQANKDKEIYKAQSLYNSRTNNFVWLNEYEDFDSVTRGEVVWLDGDSKVIMESDGNLLFPKSEIMAAGDEVFVFCQKNPTNE